MPLEPIPVVATEEVEPSAEPPSFKVELDVFSGPLELLLHLIESRELDVLTVPLATVADAYVEHLATHVVPPEQLADFVAVAARLILLKSRRLLPGEAAPLAAADTDEPDEEELRRRLIEYRVLRDAGRQLGTRDLVSPVFRREPRESDLPEVPSPPLSATLLADVLDALAAIPEPEPPPPEVVLREVTIAMQITVLRAALARAGDAGRIVLQDLLVTCGSRTEVTVTVLATLELVRRRQITIQQDDLFGPILVKAAAGDGAS